MNLESKKEKYYQWLVDNMIDQTDVDSEKITFRFVQEWIGENIEPIVYRHIEPWPSSSFLYGQVRDYLERKMGVESGIESKIIWEKFVPQLWEKIRRITGYYGGFESQLNESTEKEEKQRKYFYFIVDDLVNKTNIVTIRDMKFIELPSVLMTRYFSGKPHLSRTVPEEFEEYCKDVYGINKGFIYAVWGAYELKIHDKITNESDQH